MTADELEEALTAAREDARAARRERDAYRLAGQILVGELADAREIIDALVRDRPLS